MLLNYKISENHVFFFFPLPGRLFVPNNPAACRLLVFRLQWHGADEDASLFRRFHAAESGPFASDAEKLRYKRTMVSNL